MYTQFTCIQNHRPKYSQCCMLSQVEQLGNDHHMSCKKKKKVLSSEISKPKESDSNFFFSIIKFYLSMK